MLETQNMSTNFEEIRPYHDNEVPGAIERLLNEPSFHTAMRYVFPDKSPEELIAKLKRIRSVDEFQSDIIAHAVRNIQLSTTRGVRHEGLDKLSKSVPYLFISNHRDIVLDSAFLNYLLHTEGFPTTRIAIGNNLLQKGWITDLVKLNKNFIVHRDTPARQAYDFSMRLSNYIRHSITADHTSIWIAQKEGRAKNGLDKTHAGLLKMFGMSGTGIPADDFAQLNIVPISISYELEPCAGMKAFEMYSRSENGTYEKAPGEDLLSMKNGIAQKKGRVVYSFGRPFISSDFESIFVENNRNDALKKIASSIDFEIYKNYHLFPFHYLAFDLLNNSNRFSSVYSEGDKHAFDLHLEEQLAPCKASRKQLFSYFLEIYANPLKMKIENSQV
jgi:1-acyl-sn-glycerol-3-phosphate acyltransferase